MRGPSRAKIVTLALDFNFIFHARCFRWWCHVRIQAKQFVQFVQRPKMSSLCKKQMQIYEYLLGGFFGYNTRPARESEAAKWFNKNRKSEWSPNWTDLRLAGTDLKKMKRRRSFQVGWWCKMTSCCRRSSAPARSAKASRRSSTSRQLGSTSRKCLRAGPPLPSPSRKASVAR